jgi:hypothetical protein
VKTFAARNRISLDRLGWIIAVTLLVACGDDGPVAPPVDAGPGDSDILDDAAMEAGPADGAVNVDAGTPDLGDPCPDSDGDGYTDATCGGDDCDDADSGRFPGATEVCDGDDEDCDDATLGTDTDADGFVSSACCDGLRCGDDCDDARSDVNPTASESCNGGIDDDCDGLADAADGVCVACPTGYTGFDRACTDIDECAAGAPCGVGAAVGAPCMNLEGTYACTCASGYEAPLTGGTCNNVDECLLGTPCGVGVCTDNAGSYACSCPSGYRAIGAPLVTCVDIDECAEGSDLCSDAPLASCTNTAGDYACTCPSGFEGSGRGVVGCTDIDECALGTDDCSDAPAAVCMNAVGEFRCECPFGATGDGRGPAGCSCAPGFELVGTSCQNVDECARGLDDCDESPLAFCNDKIGTFECACPTNYVGSGRGTAGCLWNAPSLAALDVGAGGTLSPAFARTSTTYSLTVPPGSSTTTLTPTVDVPTRDTISIDGVVVESGAPFPVSLGAGLAPRIVAIVVTAESGRTLTYTVAIAARATYVKASNTSDFDAFGTSVAMSADGSTLAVGAPGERSRATGIAGDQTDLALVGAGAVYVYRRGAAGWAQEAYVKASNTAAGAAFGSVVALSADGATLAVGAPTEDSAGTGVGGVQDDTSADRAGAVYVFRRTADTWAQEAYVKASNTDALDLFGTALALSADGATLAVGATNEDSAAIGVNGDEASNVVLEAGAVYLFRFGATGWFQQAYVKASNTGSRSDEFGGAVSLSADGHALAVGARGEDSAATGIDGDQASNARSGSGAVYVFRFRSGAWSQEAYVKASHPSASDFFGEAVSLSDDGAVLAVAATGEDSSAVGVGGNSVDESALGAGAVYVFVRASGVWSQEAYVKASNTAAADGFGAGVHLSGDGSALAVGAPGEDSSALGRGGDASNNGAPASGAVYVFARGVTGWAQIAYVKATNTGASDAFGGSVALTGNGSALAVGAAREDSSATGLDGDGASDGALDSGAAYVY